jgi:sec-independent protein translocase protein TatC
MALLIRGPRAGNRGRGRDDDANMTIVEHLEDLRQALIIAGIAWIACIVVAWFFTDNVLAYIKTRAGLHESFVYFGPTGAFMIRFQVAIFAGTVLAAPIIFWQLWWFVSPGLHTNEKRVVLPLIGATTFFFALGVVLCFYALPLVINVLSGFAPQDVLQYLPNGEDFLGFLLGLCIAFGLVFELPVVLWILGSLGIISSGWLWKNRLYWVAGLGLLANFMTPGGDPLVTPLVVYIPLMIFYGGTMLLLKITGR